MRIVFAFEKSTKLCFIVTIMSEIEISRPFVKYDMWHFERRRYLNYLQFLRDVSFNTFFLCNLRVLVFNFLMRWVPDWPCLSSPKKSITSREEWKPKTGQNIQFSNILRLNGLNASHVIFYKNTTYFYPKQNKNYKTQFIRLLKSKHYFFLLSGPVDVKFQILTTGSLSFFGRVSPLLPCLADSSNVCKARRCSSCVSRQMSTAKWQVSFIRRRRTSRNRNQGLSSNCQSAEHSWDNCGQLGPSDNPWSSPTLVLKRCRQRLIPKLDVIYSDDEKGDDATNL